ncbi:MAG: YvcK family protein [Chloroflexi bacterium]|nr:YvcK family protein [Chloroflexota bacterium]
MRPGESRMARLRRWLRPTTGVSGWLIVVFVGELMLALAGGLVIRQLFRDVPADSPAGQAFNLATLQFLPDWARPVLVLVVGVAILVYGMRRLMGVLLEPFPDHTQPLVELVYQKRSLARGPRVVAIGGGTGQSTLLRGLKQLTSNITAIVTVADDGGSSGKLREELGIAPVGDIRNCIAALADAEPTMTRLLQYRFPTEQDGQPGLGGHAFGNLLIAALSDIARDFEEGVRLSNRVLAVRGQVVPVAPQPLTLHAELADGQELEGQSRIMRTRGIRRVWISPDRVAASEDATDAVRTADLVVLGPGSLYTSLLPSLLVPGIRAALEESPALRVYVCNVATQPGETEGYTLSEHLAALHAHHVGHLVDVVVANGNLRARPPADYHQEPVRIDLVVGSGSPRLVVDDVVDIENAHRHDPAKLAATLLRLLDERQAQQPPPMALRTA